MSTTKLLVGVGLGVTALVGYNYIKNLSLTNANLEITPTAMLHKINLTGIYITMDLRLKNPDAGTFAIQYPFIQLQFDGDTVGSSEIINKEITIPPNGEVVINGIMIQIPITNLLTTGYKMYKNLSANMPITMQVKTHTTIKIGWQKIPYDKITHIVIKK